jgi:pimeloyl-ACP methyl ester carboxylesterase
VAFYDCGLNEDTVGEIIREGVMGVLPDLSKYSRYADLTAGRMHYYELGSGDNHTFLLHGGGFSVNADTFQFILEPLAEHFHVYAIDAFGHGKSTRQLAYGPTFDIVVDSMRELMDQRSLTSVNIVGHSFGGWSGGLLAYESPDRVRRLAIIGGAGLNITPVEGVSNQRVPTVDSALAGIRNSIYPGSAMTEEVAEAMARQIVDDAGGEAGMLGMKPHNDQMADPASRNQYLLQRRLPFIRVPTMVIWGRGSDGRRGDTMEPYPTWTEEYEQTSGDISKTSKPWVIPNAKYVLHEGGHNIHWEHPDQVVAMLVDFLK